MPIQTNRGIDYPGQSIRWVLTPFGIDGNWDFICSIDYRGHTYSYNVTVNAVGGYTSKLINKLVINYDYTYYYYYNLIIVAVA